MPSQTFNLAHDFPNIGQILQPTPKLSSGVKEPVNSELQKIADDVLGSLKYSFSNVAAEPDRVSDGDDTIESAFKGALNHYKNAEKLNRYRKTALDFNALPKSQRKLIFGRAGKLDSKDFLKKGMGFDHFDQDLKPIKISPKLLGLSSQASDHALKNGIFNHDRLREIGGTFSERDIFDTGESFDDNFEEFSSTDKLGFYINRVKCVDETNPERFGSDEIALAGISIDETGDTKKIKERRIGGGFDDGDSKYYNPDWRYHWFSLNEGRSWPKAYAISLILAEKDHGGLSSALNKLWRKVKDKVMSMIRAAAQAAGVAISTFLGLPEAGAMIGNILGQVVGWIIDRFFKWIINAFKDDLFPAYNTRITIPSKSARWRYPNGRWGNPRSNMRYAHFYGHGGHYYIEYYWKLFA